MSGWYLVCFTCQFVLIIFVFNRISGKFVNVGSNDDNDDDDDIFLMSILLS